MTFEVFDITVKRGLNSCSLHGTTERGKQILKEILEDYGTGIFTVSSYFINETVSHLLELDDTLRIKFDGRFP